MTAHRWWQVLQMLDEAFEAYEQGMALLRKHVVEDLRRKGSESKVLDRPYLEQPLPRARPASATRAPALARGRHVRR